MMMDWAININTTLETMLGSTIGQDGVYGGDLLDSSDGTGHRRVQRSCNLYHQEKGLRTGRGAKRGQRLSQIWDSQNCIETDQDT